MVNRLVNAAVALNGVGVQIQYAKYMIEITVWLLIAQLAYLLAIAVGSGGASLALIPARVQLARMTSEIASAHDEPAVLIGTWRGRPESRSRGWRRGEGRGRSEQLGLAALEAGQGGRWGAVGRADPAGHAALRAGLTRAEMSTAERLLSAATSSLYGQATQYALTGGLTTAGTMLAQGNFSWDLLAKGITSSALGADGQHLNTALPRVGDPPRASSPYSDPPPPSSPNGPNHAPNHAPDAAAASTSPGPARSADPAVDPGAVPLPPCHLILRRARE